MEKRTIEQVRIYKLHLKDIRDQYSNDIVAIGYEKEKLINWYKDHLADSEYQEEQTEANKPNIIEVGMKVDKDGDTTTDIKEKTYYTKYFKVGSPIEWYEKPEDPLIMSSSGTGIDDSWTTQDHIDKELQKPNNKMLMID